MIRCPATPPQPEPAAEACVAVEHTDTEYKTTHSMFSNSCAFIVTLLCTLLTKSSQSVLAEILTDNIVLVSETQWTIRPKGFVSAWVFRVVSNFVLL